MTSHSHARAAAIAAALVGLALPAAASASAAGSGSGSGGSTGGAGLSSTTTSPSPSSPTGAPLAATPVGGPVSAEGNGFTVSTSAAGTYRRALSFTGSVSSSDSGDVVEIQLQGPTGNWQSVSAATVTADGSFEAQWHASTSGVVGFRAVLGGPAGSAGAASVATASSASPTLSVTIYRDAIATIYGPGFYGHKTACGLKLSATTIGVASRTLKCGTMVSIDYGGQSVTVPVIDRGPYANGASWDLTEATAAALGDPETETVGAAVL
jgi:rare lipoprotein A